VDLRQRARRAGWILCQAVLVGLALFSIVRIFQPGASQLVVLLVAVTPWPYFLAWPIAVAGLVRRRWVLGGAAVVLVVIQAVLVLPTWHPNATAASPIGTWRLKVFDANVLFSNWDLRGIAKEIGADRPNVVTLEELSHQGLASLVSTGVMAGYRYSYVQPTYDSTGFGVWSDVPLTDSKTWFAEGHSEYAGTLHPATGGPVQLLQIHTFAPHGITGVGVWGAEMSQIAARAKASPKPLIVVGDFNATNDMKQFQTILHTGLTDSAVARGEGWRQTWPRNKPIIPAFLRPDHLLYSPGLTATTYSVGTGHGSDHKPILVELARAK
jgi:endonuclease/exonuclease/phosphatase (EEP) superfamily protein YafD